MSTISKLAEITDQAAFERLATAILREAEPGYASLLHPGVNVNGKTVKPPRWQRSSQVGQRRVRKPLAINRWVALLRDDAGDSFAPSGLV